MTQAKITHSWPTPGRKRFEVTFWANQGSPTIFVCSSWLHAIQCARSFANLLRTQVKSVRAI